MRLRLCSVAMIALLRRGTVGLRTTTKVPLTKAASERVSLVAGGKEITQLHGDALVVPLFKAEEGSQGVKVEGLAAALDDLLDGAVSDMASDFKGSAGSTAKVRLGRKAAFKSVALYGLGDKASARYDKLGAYLTDLSKAEKAASLSVAAPPGERWEDAWARGVARGALGSMYVDNRFRSGDNVVETAPLESVSLLGDTSDDLYEMTDSSRKLAAGVALARDIVGAPANVVTPKTLADIALDLCEAHDLLSGKVLDRAECEQRGMGSYLGVANGAKLENGAHFIHLTYRGPSSAPDAPRSTLALIGKGLTYDSGGYNLKPSQGGMIEKMKFDCGGSAAVLGAALTVAQLEVPNVDVHFVVAACENMISQDAMRPGDILTASNGKSVEVINTDAEGRLTLADALVYVEKECKPDAVVDVATLTGACIIALGDKIAGLFTPHDTLAAELVNAADTVGENIWRMPLSAEYEEQLKSKIADLKNVGGRPAGSITAALFLKHFVSDNLPWAHLDIAGPVWDDKADAPTGFGVMMLVEWVRTRATASSASS